MIEEGVSQGLAVRITISDFSSSPQFKSLPQNDSVNTLGSLEEQKCPNKELPRKQNNIKKMSEIKSKYNTQSLLCECPKILIVDDIPFNHMAIKGLLKGRSFDQAFDGNQGFEQVAKRNQKQCCGHYRLILMDIEMPKLNGFESAKKVEWELMGV